MSYIDSLVHYDEFWSKVKFGKMMPLTNDDIRNLKTITPRERKIWRKKNMIPTQVMQVMWHKGLCVTKEEPITPMGLTTFNAKLRNLLQTNNDEDKGFVEIVYNDNISYCKSILNNSLKRL